jgi:hypothetical protein
MLIAYMLPVAQSVTTIGKYLKNLDYISTTLCVNRDRADIHCEGTCVLAQMMNKTEVPGESPFTNSENSMELIEVIGFFTSSDCLSHQLIMLDDEFKSQTISHYNYEPRAELERPPEC